MVFLLSDIYCCTKLYGYYYCWVNASEYIFGVIQLSDGIILI